MKSSALEPKAPTGIPDVEVGPLLGRGGMGSVYRARDLVLKREAALKWLPREASDEELSERFAREGRAAAALRHPHLVTVYRAGQTPEGSYLLMELVDGLTLRELLEAGALGPAALVELVAKVAEGVAAAHAAGVIHRDLKPSNIVVDAGGEPRVVDFGLARRPGEPEVTGGGVVGTVRYMAPEVLTKGSALATAAADVFSLGVLLHEGLAGEHPFSDASEIGPMIAAILAGSPRSLPLELPPRPAQLITGALSADPQSRPSAQELARGLALPLPAPARAAAREAETLRESDLNRPPLPPLPGTTTAPASAPASATQDTARTQSSPGTKSPLPKLALALASSLALTFALWVAASKGPALSALERDSSPPPSPSASLEDLSAPHLPQPAPQARSVAEEAQAARLSAQEQAVLGAERAGDLALAGRLAKAGLALQPAPATRLRWELLSARDALCDSRPRDALDLYASGLAELPGEASQLLGAYGAALLVRDEAGAAEFRRRLVELAPRHEVHVLVLARLRANPRARTPLLSRLASRAPDPRAFRSLVDQLRAQ